ncbi:MAG: hypothetical protein L0Y38_01720 [Methylococcaceae bacterium]|nr:hypothetical protein [Methylococcaceae bacterium]
MNDLRGIILDKSYLQGAPKSSFDALSVDYRVLMPDVLFYEMVSSAEPGRSRCFGKLPQTWNPIPLVPRVGAFITKELSTHQPVGCPSQNILDINFRFNSRLATQDYSFSDIDKAATTEIENELKSYISILIETVATIDTIIPNLSSGSHNLPSITREECEASIAEEKRELAGFISELSLPGNAAMPKADALDEPWAIFRWFQVQLLFSLDLRIRYGTTSLAQLTEKMYSKLEHDVLDAQYLVLGVLEGGFATKEKKLQRFFRCLCPEGILVET